MKKCETIQELIKECAALYGERPACHTGPDSVFAGPVSYRQLAADLANLCRGLRLAGLAGSHIAVTGENRYEWLLAFAAAAAQGGVAVSLDRQLTAEEYQTLLAKGQVRALVYAPAVKDKVLAVRRSYPLKLISMGTDKEADHSLAGLIAAGAAAAGENAAAAPAENGIATDPAGFSFLLFTSGTQGRAKGVMLSHRNLLSQVGRLLQANPLTAGDRVLSVLPIHHIYEMTYNIFRSLAGGAEIYFSGGFRVLAQELRQFGPHQVSLVPLVVENFYHRARLAAKSDERTWPELFGAMLGGQLKRLACGAALLNPQVHAGLTAAGLPFAVVIGYGTTEGSPVVTIDNDHSTRAGCCGTPLTDVEVRIDRADEQGRGEVLFRGPNLMLGYYQDEAATRTAVPDGWYHTGDLGSLDADGYLTIHGRLKNLLVLTNGKKLAAEEIEMDLNALPEIDTCLVTLEQSGSQAVITAEVYPNPALTHDETLEKAIRERISLYNHRFPYYRHIGRVKFRAADFERTTTNKVKR